MSAAPQKLGYSETLTVSKRPRKSGERIPGRIGAWAVARGISLAGLAIKNNYPRPLLSRELKEKRSSRAASILEEAFGLPVKKLREIYKEDTSGLALFASREERRSWLARDAAEFNLWRRAWGIARDGGDLDAEFTKLKLQADAIRGGFR